MISIDHLTGIQFKLQIMGVKVEICSALTGDDKFIILNTQYPSIYFKKKHNYFAINKAIETVVAGFVRTVKFYGNHNPIGIMTKSLKHMDI